jgi:hypothetical protein
LPQAESVSSNMGTRQKSCTQNYRRSPEGSVNVWRVINLLQALDAKTGMACSVECNLVPTVKRSRHAIPLDFSLMRQC